MQVDRLHGFARGQRLIAAYARRLARLIEADHHARCAKRALFGINRPAADQQIADLLRQHAAVGNLPVRRADSCTIR